MRTSSKIPAHEPYTRARLFLNCIPSTQRSASHSLCCFDTVLVRKAQVPALIGGSGSHAAALKSAGAMVLGDSVDAALALIDELLGAVRPAPA